MLLTKKLPAVMWFRYPSVLRYLPPKYSLFRRRFLIRSREQMKPQGAHKYVGVPNQRRVKLAARSRIDDRTRDQTGDIPATLKWNWFFSFRFWIFVLGFSHGGDCTKTKRNSEYRLENWIFLEDLLQHTEFKRLKRSTELAYLAPVNLGAKLLHTLLRS